MGVELMDSSVIWYAVLAVVVVALVFVLFNFNKVKKLKEGNDEMVEMAGIIRSGAGTFLKAEFKVIAIIGVIIALVFSLFVEATSGITFLLGGLMSSLVCIIGMKSATYANVRTANKARESLSIGETVKVALSGGSVSGIAVQAFGMLGLLLVLIIWGVDPHATGHGLVANLECNPSIMRITTYSLPCSTGLQVVTTRRRQIFHLIFLPRFAMICRRMTVVCQMLLQTLSEIMSMILQVTVQIFWRASLQPSQLLL